MKFKIGDTVKRCTYARGNMQVGDTGIIHHIINNSTCELYAIRGYNGISHNVSNLKLVKATKTNWRKRLEKNDEKNN